MGDQRKKWKPKVQLSQPLEPLVVRSSDLSDVFNIHHRFSGKTIDLVK